MLEVRVEIQGSEGLSLRPRERWVLWHITGNCNIECDYCYGSFDGGSYKKDWKPGAELSTSRAMAVPAEIAAGGFDGVHINGGEPLLRDDCFDIASTCAGAGLRTWVLTNGTARADVVDAFNRGEAGIETLAFSFDTLDERVGNTQREKSRAARRTIERVAANRSSSSPMLGIYVVLTSISIAGFPQLVDWLAEIGVDYVNVQPCYLPTGHAAADSLGLGAPDAAAVAEAYALVSDRVPKASTTGMGELATIAVGGGGVARNCFADLGDYAYIAPSGTVLGCPSKPTEVALARGSVARRGFDEIMTAARVTETLCNCLTTDCLGMYEMALGPART